jgi:nitrogen fixation protein FixH
MFVGGFGIIIGVNVFMAWNAISTFPGMEVSSSYADSQTFDIRRDAQEALGWDASVGIEGDTLILTLVDEAGRPVYPAELDALLTRPTNQTEDQTLVLTRGTERHAHRAGGDQRRALAPAADRRGTRRHGIPAQHHLRDPGLGGMARP